MLQVRKRCMPLRMARQNLQNCDLKTHATPANATGTATKYDGEAITGMNLGPSDAIKKQDRISDF